VRALLSPARRLAGCVALPPDTWERHAIVADLLGEPASVLDVGGVAGQLRRFLPRSRITSVNVEGPADVVFDGSTLPFPDSSFEAVTSLDVLEHVDPAERRAHVEELVRVASLRVVLCCPLGTDDHVRAEHELAGWHLRVTGRPHRFLEEHLRNGLPSEAELRRLASDTGCSFRLAFSGDFRRVDELFRLGVLARARRRPRDLAAYARARLGPRAEVGLSVTSGPYTNRAFLVGEPTAGAAGRRLRPPRPRS
jgi:hypothetical protein